jgi:hypothetical protein
MTQPAALTGQTVGEAEGALTALMERALAPTGRTRADYITLRVIATRAPIPAAALTDYLATQRQLALDPAAAADLLAAFHSEALITSDPVALTSAGQTLLADLTALIAPLTRAVFADLDPTDLTTTARILTTLTTRAHSLTP